MFFFFFFRENKKHIPFILKHCFKNVVQEAGSETNVSAVCKKCSKTLKGSLNASRIECKKKRDLLELYEKLKPLCSKKRKFYDVIALYILVPRKR